MIIEEFEREATPSPLVELWQLEPGNAFLFSGMCDAASVLVVTNGRKNFKKNKNGEKQAKDIECFSPANGEIFWQDASAKVFPVPCRLLVDMSDVPWIAKM